MAIISHVLTSGSTFKTVGLIDATDFSISESGTPTNLVTDGSRSVGLICISGKTATATVNGINAALCASANFKVGSTGALVLKARVIGAGDAVSTALTFTANEAVLISTSATVGETNGTFSATFNVYDASDDNTLFVIS